MKNLKNKLLEVISSVKILLTISSRIKVLEVRLEEQKVNQGVILSNMNKSQKSRNLKDYEFKIFSQWGEDGIIQHLLDVVELEEKTFIEFGVESFFESNCRFLMMKDNWRGFVIDGSSANIASLRNSVYFWKFDLQALDAFITKDNINELLMKSGFNEDVGILSIDIDGNDYFVLDAIMGFRPRILICEYNAVFGSTRKISIPYDEHFNRTEKHFSNLYFGASLSAITYLANKKGYELVGVNSTGGNAFFVRRELINDKLEILTAEDAWFPSNVRESRDKSGNLTLITGDSRLDLIKGMPVFNVETLELEKL